MKKILLFAVMFAIIAPIASAYELQHYPQPFIKSGKFDAVLIVGDNAKARDVVGITDIGMSLQYDMQLTKTVFREGCGDYRSNELVRVDVGAVQLASSVRGKEKENNLILVGGPCANPVTANLLGYPEDCTEGFEYGKGKIQLFDHGNGKYALLVAGLLEEDTRAAAKVLANYKQYKEQFRGKELIVTDTASTKPKITVIG